jgi:hypothetical protein
LFEELVPLISIFVFSLMNIAFTYTYYKKIVYVKKEYDSAKNLVSGIVFTFEKRLEEQKDKIKMVLYDIENLQSSSDKKNEQNNYLELKINNLIKNFTSVYTINEKIINNLLLIKKNINELKITDEKLYKKIDSFKINKDLLQKSLVNLPTNQKTPLIKLNNTETKIINILLSEGAKTAPEIMKRIGNTREHTSRLMKKLWQEGFIERDTYVIPFIYRPTKELEKRIRQQ